MDIAIIGAGNVGGALGRRWAQTGHRVRFGVRAPGEPKVTALLATAGPHASAADVATAARDAEVVVIATPWAATQEAVRAAGDLGGRVVIDCTNPLKPAPGVGLELTVGFSDSGGEQVARWAPGAHVVKAFNTYGWENFADARYPNAAGLRPLMFLAGNEATAKTTVATLAEAIGFEPFDAGPLSAARLLEPMGLLWIRQALSGDRSPNFTWACLRRT